MEIKIENLKKIYGDKTVVDIAQLTLGSGELIG
ncbi:MAG: ABC transporter ATP-binding protein, partial [Prevotella sp.]